MKCSSNVAVFLATAVAATSLLGCATPAVEDTEAPVPNQVTVADRSYTPASITVGVGDTVTWVFDDGGMTHDVVADDKSFRSPLRVSGTFAHTFTEPGTFTYHCTPHPDMLGTVVVQP